MQHTKQLIRKLYTKWWSLTSHKESLDSFVQFVEVEAGIVLCKDEYGLERKEDCNEIYFIGTKYIIKIVDDSKFIYAKLKYL